MRKTNLFLLTIVLVFTLVVSACALDFEPKESADGQVKLDYPAVPEPPKMVEVQFQIHSAKSFSEDDAIALDVLDLVGGFQHNIERYHTNLVGPGTHRVTVSLPEGATIAYRYSLLEPVQVPEVLADGSSLPFRQVFVKKNLIVSDIIAGWPENSYDGPLADLNGAVANNLTEQPLADVLVNVAGKITMTDMNGRFFLRDLPVGKHNLVATTVDGSHQTFQQEVNLVDSLSTLAIARMNPNPEITLTFVLTPPKEVFGASIRIAGNLEAFGQTSFDQVGGTGLQAVNMPLLTPNSDGSYLAQLSTYAGNVLRYSYTLGDSIIGVERNEQGLRVVRQFVVPSVDAVVHDSVISWRSSVATPSTFYAQVPQGTPPEDKLYMQFNQGFWSNPIPMWKTADDQWVLVYFPAFPEPSEVQYHYCRFADCIIGAETNPNGTERSFMIGTQNEIHDQIPGWRFFDPQAEQATTFDPIPFPEEALVGIELDPHYASNAASTLTNLVNDLSMTQFNWIILRPAWKVSLSDGLPFIDADPLTTLPSETITLLAGQLKSNGFKVAVFPKLDFSAFESNWWQDSSKNSLWWQQWYSEYERMVTHLIKLAGHIQADQLILGGPDVWQSYPGALETVGDNYGTPKTSEEIWTELLKKTDQYYDGEIVLAHALTEMGSQRYSFYDQADALYLLIDSDVSLAGAYSAETVGQYLDGVIYAMIEGQTSELLIGLNGPSFQTSVTGVLPSSSSTLSPLADEFGSYNINMHTQNGFYFAYLQSIAARGWIAGAASRGFYPGIKLSDFSSSIYGKPAFQLFHNQ